MGARSIFGGFLRKLKGVVQKAPPRNERAEQERVFGGAGLNVPQGTREAGGDFQEGVPEEGAVQDYLYFGQWMPVSSSNVKAIRYDNRAQTLYVEFLSHGSVYEYPGVDVDLAYTFAVAASKGKWVWENLRNAGRAYRFLFSADGHRPDPARKTVVFSRKAERRVKKRLFERAAKDKAARVAAAARKHKKRGMFAGVFGR